MGPAATVAYDPLLNPHFPQPKGIPQPNHTPSRACFAFRKPRENAFHRVKPNHKRGHGNTTLVTDPRQSGPPQQSQPRRSQNRTQPARSESSPIPNEKRDRYRRAKLQLCLTNRSLPISLTQSRRAQLPLFLTPSLIPPAQLPPVCRSRAENAIESGPEAGKERQRRVLARVQR